MTANTNRHERTTTSRTDNDNSGKGHPICISKNKKVRARMKTLNGTVTPQHRTGILWQSSSGSDDRDLPTSVSHAVPAVDKPPDVNTVNETTCAPSAAPTSLDSPIQYSTASSLSFSGCVELGLSTSIAAVLSFSSDVTSAAVGAEVDSVDCFASLSPSLLLPSTSIPVASTPSPSAFLFRSLFSSLSMA